MNTESKVVVWDPEAKYWPGALIEASVGAGGDAGGAGALAARGVVLLPVVPKLFRLSGVGGFAKREWGSGWPLRAAPGVVAPLTMYCTTDYGDFHWAARVVGEGRCEGSLRLAHDPSQPNPMRLGLSPDTNAQHVDFRQLGPADAHGGWTLTGRAKAKVPGDGHYGFALYGAGPGLRVVWAAMSLSARE